MSAQTIGSDRTPEAALYTTHTRRAPGVPVARPEGLLTPRQIEQFRDDGYLIIDPRIPARLLDRVRREMEPCYPRAAGGQPGRVLDAWRVNPGVKDLALAPGVRAVLEELYGRE